MKTSITRKIEWDMGHRLPNHDSLCRHPHGHRYVAEVTIEGPVNDTAGDSSRGMVEDFGTLKLRLEFITKEFDHSFMVFKEDPFAAVLALFEKNYFRHELNTRGAGLRVREMDFVPTAENIAAYIFKRLEKGARDTDVVQVTVWETPNCSATVGKIFYVPNT